MAPGGDEERRRAEELLACRAAARAARDFATADSLRGEIAGLGFDVVDAPAGASLVERPPFDRLDPARLPDRLSEPPTLEASVHVLYEGHRSDLWRFVESLGRSEGAFEVVVLDNASDEGEWLPPPPRPRGRR